LKYTLKELRARANLTQEELAKKLGLSRQSYINIEKEPRKASCKRMVEIAEILGVGIGDIFLS